MIPIYEILEKGNYGEVKRSMVARGGIGVYSGRKQEFQDCENTLYNTYMKDAFLRAHRMHSTRNELDINLADYDVSVQFHSTVTNVQLPWRCCYWGGCALLR